MANLSSIIAPNNVTTATNTQTLTNKTLQSANITSGLTLTGAAGTAGQVLTSAGSGSAPSWATVSAGFTLGTPVATTSGTAFTFTGIPSTAKVIFLSLANVSFTGAVLLLITLGDAGGLETSGYLTHGGQIYDNSLAVTLESANSIRLARSGAPPTAASGYSGVLTLTLLESSTNTWSYSGAFGMSSAEYGSFVGGTKSLTQVLDRISISGGTFDDGKVNIAYI